MGLACLCVSVPVRTHACTYARMYVREATIASGVTNMDCWSQAAVV